MTDLTQGGRIRDPIHGYILFTGLEREVINHPIAQRLRHISQSGMAQMVFPEVRSSRFSHSLGAMHLSSQFLASSLRSADDPTRKAIQDAVKDAVENHARFAFATELKPLMDSMVRQGLSAGMVVDDDYRAQTLLVEQGLRLAALFHDLGHLPFSHDFEEALGDLFRLADESELEGFHALGEESRLALHERIGTRLAHHMQREIFKELMSEPQSKAVEVAFLIAEDILEAPPSLLPPGSPREALYRWLHTLIASELDVDRCDYILRDTRHYGFEFASYDLPRIVDNLIVVKQPSGEFAMAVRPQGQSALESFLLARFRMYQWGVRHHKVVQVAAALRHVIRREIWSALKDSTHQLRQFLDDLVAILDSPGDFADDHGDVLRRYAGYDDVWWTNWMRTVARQSKDPWLHLVCSRRPGPESLWKRVPDFPVTDLLDWNSRLPGPADDVGLAAWAQAENELIEKGVLVVRNSFEPWRPLDRNDPDSESWLAIAHPDRGLVPLTTVSHLTKALRPAWMKDVQVYAFAAAPDLMTKEQVVEALPLGNLNEGGEQ